MKKLLSILILLNINLFGASLSQNIKTDDSINSYISYSKHCIQQVKELEAYLPKELRALIKQYVCIHYDEWLKNGESLINSIESSDSKAPEQLLESGEVDFNVRDKEGRTALMIAFQNSDEIVKLLIEKKADVNAKYANNKTLLMMFCFDGNLEDVKLLLNSKADVNAKDDENSTALMHALCDQDCADEDCLRHRIIVDLLKQHGAKEE